MLEFLFLSCELHWFRTCEENGAALGCHGQGLREKPLLARWWIQSGSAAVFGTLRSWSNGYPTRLTDGDDFDGSLIFRNFHMELFWNPNIWQMSSNPNSMRKNMFHRPSGFFHLLPTVVRVFHTMRVPISPLETSNHLDDSLGSSCRSEPKVYLNNPLVYHTLHPMFSCQLWNHIEMLFIHIYIYTYIIMYIYNCCFSCFLLHFWGIFFAKAQPKTWLQVRESAGSTVRWFLSGFFMDFSQIFMDFHRCSWYNMI